MSQQRKESLLKGRRAVHERVPENHSKREFKEELPTDVVSTSNPRRRRLDVDLSTENATNAKMHQTVSCFVLDYFTNDCI